MLSPFGCISSFAIYVSQLCFLIHLLLIIMDVHTTSKQPMNYSVFIRSVSGTVLIVASSYHHLSYYFHLYFIVTPTHIHRFYYLVTNTGSFILCNLYDYIIGYVPN